MFFLLEEGKRAKEVQASPMRGNEGENTRRENRKVKGRETGRVQEEKRANRNRGASVTVSPYSSVNVSPTALEGKRAKRLSETGHAEKRKQTGSKGRENRK